MLKLFPLVCMVLFTLSTYSQSASKALKTYKKTSIQGIEKTSRTGLITYYDQSGKYQKEFTQLLAENYLVNKMPDSALIYLQKWKSSNQEGAAAGLPELESKANDQISRSKDYVVLAEKALLASNFEEAYKNGKLSLDLDITKAKPFHIMAVAANNQKDIQQSNQLFEAAMTKQFESLDEEGQIIYDYSHSLYTQRDGEASILQLKKITKGTYLPKAQLLLARNYKDMRQYRNCFNYLSKYLHPSNQLSDDEYFEGYLLKGKTYVLRGGEKSAIEAYEKALEYQPEQTEILGEIAQLYYNQKDYNHSLQSFEKLDKLTKPSYDSYKMQGNCQYLVGNLSEAQQLFQKAFDLNSDEQNLIFNLGLVAFQNKNFELAKKMWESLLPSAEKDPSLQLGVCKLYRELKNYDKAQEQLNNAIKSYPVIGSLYEEQAALYDDMGREEDAKIAKESAAEHTNNKLTLTIR